MTNRQNKILIALDLDGTSVSYTPHLAMDAELMCYLASVKDRGISWVMNSDRYTDTMKDLASYLPAQQKPSALLSCQRFIHLRHDDDGYLPAQEWNSEQITCHSQLWNKISKFFPHWRLAVEAQFEILEYVINDLVFAYRVTPDQTPALRRLMEQFIEEVPEAQVSGNKDWTFILHASFSKAKVLKKCAELLDVALHQVIAIGDGMNDMTMLNGDVTKLVGCPANASPEVVRVVRQAGGIVSQKHEAAGTLDIIQRFLERFL